MSREDEARRDLRRLEEQSEKILGASPAGDAEDDRIEILGRRIARIITYAAAAFLLYWFWSSWR